MLVYQQREFLLFVLNSFLSGVFLGAVYDVFRISRLMLGITVFPVKSADKLYRIKYPLVGTLKVGRGAKGKVSSAVIFLQDVLFSLISGLTVVITAFFGNDGKVRVECVLICAIGFLLYYVSIGRMVIALSSYIAFAIRITMVYLLFFAALPFKLIIKGVIKLRNSVYSFADKRIKAYLIIKDSKKYTAYVMRLGENAFLKAFAHTEGRKGKTDGSKKKI